MGVTHIVNTAVLPNFGQQINNKTAVPTRGDESLRLGKLTIYF